MLASRRAWRLSSRLAVLLLPGCAAVLGIEDGTTQGACATADECAPGYSCLLGQCRAGCQSDGDCGGSATCLDLGGPSACLPSDATCGGAAECPDGTACEAERCRNLCDTTADCPGGQECDRGYCFSAEGGVGGSGGMGGRGGSSGNGGSGGGVGAEGGMSGDTGSGGSSGGGAGKGGGGGSAGMSGGPRCGDGTRDTSENCDDGNDQPGDGCTNCAREAGFSCTGDAPTVCVAICGDGQVVGREARAGGCDDNDEQDGDGCDAGCAVEDGWSCTGEPSRCTEGCGDGVVGAGEGCDDGNAETGDGCAACAIEPGYACEDDGGASVCEDIDECTTGDAECDANADCIDVDGGYDCECRPGWEGPGDTCADVNECDDSPCSPDATCTNSDGSFACECDDGYAGDGTVCQDASVPDWPVPRAPDYTVTGDVVLDNVTGLTWQRATDGPYARAAAVSHCKELEVGGFSDWRLPTRVELGTLFFTRANGSDRYIDETTFPDTELGYWTISPQFGVSSSGWTFSFSELASDPALYSEAHHVRCVRSTPNGVAPERFTVLSSALVRDNETGLVWTSSAGSNQNRLEASSVCADLVSGSYSDFRLPTLGELLTILKDDAPGAKLDITYFSDPGTQTPTYWTATTMDANRVGSIDFVDGVVGTSLQSSTNVRRRCVQAAP